MLGRKYWKIHNLYGPNRKTSYKEITKNIRYTLQFIDSAEFMASSLSNLLNNLFEGNHRIKCKWGHEDKNVEIYGIPCKYCDCFSNIQTLNMI